MTSLNLEITINNYKTFKGFDFVKKRKIETICCCCYFCFFYPKEIYYQLKEIIMSIVSYKKIFLKFL